MNSTITIQEHPSVRARRPASPVRSGAALAVSLGVVVYLWSLNYNKLGSFFDYSIMADAAGKFAAGLRPFRDYTSALQTFPIWVARACEIVFGPRYLALAYGNLVLTLGLFLLLVQFARKVFSLPVAILIAMAVCVASSLQHGIIWYNSIGLFLLSAVVLKCADLVRARHVRAADAVRIAALVLCLGMTKLNFFALAMAMVVFSTAVAAFTIRGLQFNKGFVALFVAACALPPFIEVFANHTTFSTWLREVVLSPAHSRTRVLIWAINPALYFEELNRWFPGTVLKGAVFCSFMIYIFLAYRATRTPGDTQAGPSGRLVRLSFVGIFWASTIFLVLTNSDIESLSLCFSVVGIVAMRISEPSPGEEWSKALRNSAMFLSVYFLLVGGTSLARHSRVSFVGNTFPGQVVRQADGAAYLRGVELSPQAAARLTLINKILSENSGASIYWGPGLELMNRMHPGVTDPAFPLWYQMEVTVHESDGPALSDALERSGAQLFVAERFWYDFKFILPQGFRDSLARSWTLEDMDDSLVVYRRKTTAAQR